MQIYYSRQATLPHFSGHAHKKDSGIGFLALGVCRVALLFAKTVLLLAVKSIGKQLFVQSLPDLMNVSSNKVFQTSCETSCKKNS